MRITLNDKDYYIDDEKLTSYLYSSLERNLDKKFKLAGGPSIDLTRTSLMSVAIRQMFAFVVPLLKWAAVQLHVEVPEKKRHEDIIRYTMKLYFAVLKKSCTDMHVTFTDKPYVDELHIIDSVDIEKESSGLTVLNFKMSEL